MKKINFDENESTKYTNVVDSEPKEVNSEPEDEIKEEKKNQPTQEKYVVVDPKKRKMLYFTMVIAFLLVVGLIIVNFNMTKKQTGQEVTTEITTVGEAMTNQNGEIITEPSTMETTRVIPTYSIFGTWRTDDGFLTLGFDQESRFIHSVNIDGTAMTYTGNYYIHYGDFALEEAGYSTADDASAIFHVSKEDLNLSNLAYVQLNPTSIMYDDGTKEDFSNEGEGEDDGSFFEHLVYLSEDSNGNVTLTYYDEEGDMLHTLKAVKAE